MVRRTPHEGRRRAIGALFVLLLAPLGPALSGEGAPIPLATDFAGDGVVQDAGAFGIYGARVEATVWAATGIAAGPSQVAASAGGAYNWSFSQVTSTGLVNITLRAWLPWNPNVTVQAVFDISNGTPNTTYPGVVLALPFTAVESVALAAAPSTITVPRGRSVNVSVQLDNDGNTSVAHDGLLLSSPSPSVSAVTVGSAPGTAERLPGSTFSYDLSVSTPPSAAPENTSLNLTVASLSGTNLTFSIPVRVSLNRNVAVAAIGSAPDPPAEGTPGAVVVTVENKGLDLAPAVAVQVLLFNATAPSLYSNSTSVDLAGGTRANLSFVWTPAWSPDPVSAFAAASVADDFDSADDGLTVSFTIRSSNVAPAVSFATPAQMARISGTVPVAGSASDPEGGALTIDFAVDGGAPFLRVNTSSFAFAWDVSALPDGPHVLSAVATDERGDFTRANRTVIVLNRGPNAAPTITVDNPVEGDVLGATTRVSGHASDERGELVAVYISVDGGPEAIADGTVNWSFALNASALTPGNHTLLFRAWDGIDSSGVLARNVTVNLSAPASVRVEGAALQPATAIPGQSIVLMGRVMFDTGAGADGAAVTASVRGYPTLFETFADARGIFQVQVTAPPAQGTFVVDAFAASGNLTGTGSASLTVSVATLPDIELLPSDFSVTPSPPVPNQPAHHTVNIRNVGAAAANATLRVYENGTLVFERSEFIQTSRQVPFDRTYTPGTHNLTVRIEDVSPQDGNPSNNELLVTIEVPGLPDFSVQSVIPSIPNPQAGRTITFLVVVGNVGVADGTAALELWDGEPLGANSTLIRQEFLALEAGKTARVLAPWNATEGTHNIVAKVVLSQPAESNLLNNELNVTVVAAGPDQTAPPPLLPGFGGLLAAGALGAGALWRRPPRRRLQRPGPGTATAAAVLLLSLAAVGAAVLPGPSNGSLQDAGAVPGPLEGVCQTCHANPNGGGPLNPFGTAYWAERNATNGSVDWNRLGALDSDGDGATNGVELNGSYLPGDPASNPQTGVKYQGYTPGDLSAIATGLVVLLFISVVGAWLGYSSFKRRAARQAAKAAAKAGEIPPDADAPAPKP